jgi:hypothetical protein
MKKVAGKIEKGLDIGNAPSYVLDLGGDQRHL